MMVERWWALKKNKKLVLKKSSWFEARDDKFTRSRARTPFRRTGGTWISTGNQGVGWNSKMKVPESVLMCLAMYRSSIIGTCLEHSQLRSTEDRCCNMCALSPLAAASRGARRQEWSAGCTRERETKDPLASAVGGRCCVQRTLYGK
jgi:hypothetical protein